MASPTYREVTPAPRWFIVLLMLLALGPLWSAYALFSTFREVEAAMLLLCSVLLLLVAVTFTHLSVEVTGAALRFRFGPFGPTLAAARLRSARAERYNWWAFGGWGIRFGRLNGQSA